MKTILEIIIGEPSRNSLESRIYNALTFFTPLATVFVIPLIFILDLSLYHIASVLLICSLGFYLYYKSRFRKGRSELFLIVTGMALLTVIWVTGYGSVGYVFLFYQFLMLYSLLVLENKSRTLFFFIIPAAVLALSTAEYFGITVPKRYSSESERIVDFLINFSVWFIFIGLIIKVIIDNFRMERQRLEDELRVAQKLQLRLLPQAIPPIPGFSLHARYLPMEKVGGDFYDYRVGERFIDILIADVSGHGMPGAFLSTITKMAFEYERYRVTPADILARVNTAVLGATVDSNFVTVFHCIIDRATRIMRCASAGHFPALLYRRGSGIVEQIKPRGKPLGLIEDISMEEIEVQLLDGDRLVLYTDGITECCNSRGTLFGTNAFIDAIVAGAGKTAEAFSSDVIGQLADFSGADFFEDDITLVVFDVC